jgi:ribonucleotide reductase beta subunit family protein with ferritin-like domain
MIKEVRPSVDIVHSLFEEGATQEIDWCKATYGNKILGISEDISPATFQKVSWRMMND